jgi:hypothetical protein
LLIEDITLVRSPEHVTAHIRFKGGASQTIHSPVRRRSTDPRAVAEAQRLPENQHDHASIAAVPNQTGTKTARGKSINAKTVPMADLRATGGAV